MQEIFQTVLSPFAGLSSLLWTISRVLESVGEGHTQLLPQLFNKLNANNFVRVNVLLLADCLIVLSWGLVQSSY